MAAGNTPLGNIPNHGNLKGFGDFLTDLSKSLTNENIKVLTTALDFRPAERDRVEESDYPGHVFVHLLREKGIINERDISHLTKKLQLCDLQGVADKVNQSFKTYQSLMKPPSRESQEFNDDGANPNHTEQSFFEFLESLGLLEHWSHKISLVEGITIKDTEENSQKLIAAFIAKVSSYDCRIQNLGQFIPYQHHHNDADGDRNETALALFEDEDSLDETENTDDDLSWIESDFEETESFSSRDILYAILSCLDLFFLQETLTKLSASQIAVPVLMPHYDSAKVTFLLWGLRKICKTWQNALDTSVVTASVVSYDFVTITALRIGDIHLSKSNVLNKLLGPTQGNEEHPFFISSEQCSHAAQWSQGVLEAVWFTPSVHASKDHIMFPFALFNLRGNYSKFSSQTQYSLSCSDATIAFIDKSDILKHQKGIEYLKSFTQVILVRCPTQTNTNARKTVKQRVLAKSKVITVDAEGITALELSVIISRILKKVKKTKESKLENTKLLCKNLNIEVDEGSSDCKDSKENAANLIDLIQADTKENHFKFQAYWQQWVKVDKESVQEREGDTIDDKISAKNADKHKLRKEQADIKPSQAVEHFISSLKVKHKNKRNFFLFWSQIFLNDLSSLKLNPLIVQLMSVSRQIRDNSGRISKIQVLLEKEENQNACSQTSPEVDDVTMDKTQNAPSQLRSELEVLMNKESELIKEEKQLISDYDKHSIGLEHLMRELGQIAESKLYTLGNSKSSDENVKQLPLLAAELLLEGYPIEIMDGDANYVPLRWVKAILKALINILGNDANVYVISVLGIQSSGKSTLLNSMFGARFAVSAGRCTRGAFLQLIPVKNSKKCQYIALVDTEGLQAPERLVSNQSVQHDNELGTFALCISDLTLINIAGQTVDEGMTNILEIAAHAFIRMKEVELNAECRIVQQFVADLSAEHKNETGMQAIFLKLDEAIRNAAKAEGKQNKYRQFSDIFMVQNYSSESQNVQYIPNLWRGVMSPPDSQYSAKVQLLKSAILNSIETKIGATLTIEEFSDRISDVWKAIKEENFVFSFRNSKDVSLYEEFMLEYRQWVYKVRVSLIDERAKVESQIENAAGESSINSIKEKSIPILSQLVNRECEKIRQKIKNSLKEEKYLPVNKHSCYFYADLDAFELDVTTSFKKQLDSISELNKNVKCKGTELEIIEKEMSGKVLQVAESFKKQLDNGTDGDSKIDVEKTIAAKFEKSWQLWMSEKRKKYKLRSIESIKKSIEDLITQNILKHCRNSQLDKHVQRLLNTRLALYSNSTSKVNSISDLENIKVLFNNYDRQLNAELQGIEGIITKFSLDHCSFKYHVHSVAIICKEFIASQTASKNTFVTSICASFLWRTHEYQCENEVLYLLKNQERLKDFVKSKNLISKDEISEVMYLSFCQEIRCQLQSKEVETLLKAIEKPYDFENQDIFQFDNNGIISVVSNIGNFLFSLLKGKPEDLENTIESFKNALPAEFDKLQKRSGDYVCNQKCIEIFSRRVIGLCAPNKIPLKVRKRLLSFAFTWAVLQFERSFDKCLRKEIWSKNYQMQLAEPLNYGTIEAKIHAFIISLQNNTGWPLEDIREMEKILTPINVEKYSRIPFDSRFIQRMDNQFIENLPLTSKRNLENIHFAVCEQKQSLLSGEQHLAPFDPFTLSKHMTEIMNAKEKDAFTNDVKSVAIVHIGAWLIPICSYLQYQFEKSKNVAILLEKEKPMLQTQFLSHCSNKADKLIAAALCNVIKTSLKDGLNSKVCHFIMTEMTKHTKAFMLKRTFIGTVLHELCNNDDFIGIVDFLIDFKSFSLNWILDVLSKTCNNKENSLIRNEMETCIDKLVSDAVMCIRTTQTSFNQCFQKSLTGWLEIFLKAFTSSTGLYCKELDIQKLKKYLNVSKFDIFCAECIDRIKGIAPLLKKEVCLPTAGDSVSTKTWLLELPTKIHEEIFDSFKGCTEQCPFCGAVCEDSLTKHDKHQVLCHFPKGINGRHWIKTNKLVASICTSSMLGDITYNTPSWVSDPERRLYKDYQVDYPDWYIPGIEDDGPTNFWKYVFCKFNKDFAKRYDVLEADIPQAWENVTKTQALKSVLEVYSLAKGC